MQRDCAYLRKERKRIVYKKCSLLKKLGYGLYEGYTRGEPGRLAKGKIHCSCWMCRKKSYDSLSHQDLKHEEYAVQQFLEVGIERNPSKKY